MQRHHGGLLPDGTLPGDVREWEDDESSVVVAVTPFDFSRLDNVEDFAREALNIPGGFRQFVAALKTCIQADCRKDILLRLIGACGKFSNQYMAFDILKDCFGLAALEGKTGVDYAKQWGISKEAWQQQREKMRRILNSRKTRTMRDEKARANMRLHNYRRA